MKILTWFPFFCLFLRDGWEVKEGAAPAFPLLPAPSSRGWELEGGVSCQGALHSDFIWERPPCTTCWWHDWSISPGSARVPLITLLNITPGEALLEAQSLCFGNGVHWRPIQPFLWTLARLNGPPVKPFRENMPPGCVGGRGLSPESSLMDWET